MRLFLLAALTMVAFASNSILNRAALAGGITEPAAFAAIRMVSGAVILAALVFLRGGFPRLIRPGRWIGASSLLVYMVGFSFAYVALDAGVGALILFGVVQITMFAGGLMRGERPPRARWIGASIALAGLAWLLWPVGAGAPEPLAASLMALAAVAWGIYSLAGKGAGDAIGDTAANFILAAPATLIVWIVTADQADARGAVLAIVAGAVTSGMGYALWYTVLPKIDSSVAALTQLTVPVIALALGAILLAEFPDVRLVLTGALVLGGVAYGVLGAQKTMGSRGS